jgi:hypothetical protein
MEEVQDLHRKRSQSYCAFAFSGDGILDSPLFLAAIRAAGALTSALAGIAALLTDGAFVRREEPLSGWWKDTPFGHYRITGWGGFLLFVILLAPSVQFVGDSLKDRADSKSLADTATTISKTIDQTVRESTKQARKDIENAVASEGQQQRNAQNAILLRQIVTNKETSQIAAQASDMLKTLNDTLFPMKDVQWAFKVAFNLKHPIVQRYLQKLRALYKSDSRDGLSGPTHCYDNLIEAGNTKTPCFLVFIDSKFMPDADDPILGLVLGYGLSVDIFKTPPVPFPLNRSADYATDLLDPYDADTYGMGKAGHFPQENYRIFQLVYYPPLPGKKDSEELFVLKYWDAMASFDVIASRTKSTIVGLADLANATFVIGLTDCIYMCDQYPGTGPALTLSALKMRTGDEETIFSSHDLQAPTRISSGAEHRQIYRVSMPSTFPLLMNRFDTVRSNLETRPLSETHLLVGPPKSQ